MNDKPMTRTEILASWEIAKEDVKCQREDGFGEKLFRPLINRCVELLRERGILPNDRKDERNCKALLGR